MKTALFYETVRNSVVNCQLCPHNCSINEGRRGTCGVRLNHGGELVSETYERISALHFDPIEKKPLYHFHPGNIILSIGSIGCNLRCSFCQNCNISQATPETFHWFKTYTVEEVVDMATDQPSNLGIAFTYNEPAIYYEYMLEIAQQAKQRDLKTVMVTNGFINQQPLKDLLPFMDAFNVDLKAFRDDFYKRQAKARLQPVLETLQTLRKYGKHVEMTNLVIPGLNDDRQVFREMIDWIHGEMGAYAILHLSRYFPHHEMKINSTPAGTLQEFFDIASEKLAYVYIGNMATSTGQNTYCPECGALLINRSGYQTDTPGLNGSPACRKCGTYQQNLII